MLIMSLLVLGNGFIKKYPELVVGYFGFIQQICLLNQPQLEHGRTLPMKLQLVELWQWGKMV